MRVAVVGAGVVGLSAVVGLLERGAEVTCLERATPMGERSAGSSRIFRLAHADPELVELADTARAGFRRWAEFAGRTLVSDVGCVFSGEGMADRAAAMAAVGAEHRIIDGAAAGLPVRHPPERVLIDPA
ncbi:MAG: FAD-dependent oxidoreductase, partial [Acidimicrobiales bacterium]